MIDEGTAKQIYEQSPDESVKVQHLISENKEKWEEYKKSSPLYSASPTVVNFTNNPLFKPFGIAQQKSLTRIDNAYALKKEDGIIGRTLQHYTLQGLYNERNELAKQYADAKTETERSYLRERMYAVERPIRTIQGAEGFGDEVLSGIASFADSAKRTLPYTIASAGAGLGLAAFTGGGVLPYVAAAGIRALGGYQSNYDISYNALLYEQNVNQGEAGIDPNVAKERARTGAVVSSSLEAAGDVFGLTAMASTSLARNIVGMSVDSFRKSIQKRAAEKAAKGAIAKKAASFISGAASEATTEALQDITDIYALKGADVSTIAKNTVGDVANIFGKIASGEELSEDERGIIRTFATTAIASLVFGGGIDVASSSIGMAYTASRQRYVNMGDQKVFEEKKRNGNPAEVNKAENKSRFNAKIMPERRYASAKDLSSAITENLQNEELSDAQRTELTELLEKVKTAEKTTGIFEIDGEEHANIFLNPENETLYQRTLGSFYYSPLMIDESFSSEQLTMQAIGEMMPEALDQDSAFYDAYNALMFSESMTEDEIILNALQYNALMNTVSAATGDSYKKIKEDNGIELTLEKGFISDAVEGARVKEKEVDIDNLKTDIASPVEKEMSGDIDMSTVVAEIDKDGTLSVIDGNKRVREAKRRGEKKATIKVVKKKDSKPIKQKKAEQLNLFQKGKEGVAGFLSINRNAKKMIITLLNTANPTTFSHESFHLFDTLIGDAYRAGRLNSYWTRQYEKMYSGAGVKNASSAIMTGKIEEDKKERLAEAWNEYLAKGQSPNKRFENMFAKFKSMFAEIYRNFVRSGALNKEIRKVFDRVFLSYKEAEVVLRASLIGAMERPAGYSDETYQKYVSAYRRSVAISSNKVVKAVRELSDIKNYDVYKEEYAKKEAELNEQAKSDLTFRVQDYLTNKPKVKLKISDLNDILPDGARIKGFTTAESSGLSLNDFLSYLSGLFGEKINQSDFVGIITGETKSEFIERETNDYMQGWLREQFPNLFEQMDAYNNLSTIDAVDAIIYEIIFLNKADEKVFGEIKALIEKAFDETLNTTAIKEFNKPNKYKQMLMSNILKQRALNKDSADLKELKFNQAILLKMSGIAKELGGQLKAFERHFSTYRNEQDTTDVKKMDSDSYELIRSIAKDLGLKVGKPRSAVNTFEKLSNWLEKHNDGAIRMYPDLDMLKFGFDALAKNNGKSYLDLSVSDFESIRNLMVAIEKISIKDTYASNEQAYNEETNDINTLIEHLNSAGFVGEEKGEERIFSMIEAAGNQMPRFLTRFLPESINLKYVAPFVNGVFKATVWKRDRTLEVESILKDEQSRLRENVAFNISVDGQEMSVNLTREQALMMMLHSGTQHNANCMMRTILMNPAIFGITIENKITDTDMAKAAIAYRQILSQTPKEIQSVARKIWDLIDSYKNDFANAYKDSTGLIMRVEELSQFEFEGNEYLGSTGGYFPATRSSFKYDNGSFGRSFVNKTAYRTADYAKDRTNEHGDLNLSLKSVDSWIYTVGDYINVAHAYNKLAHFFNRDEVSNRIGSFLHSKIIDWMSYSTKSEKTNDLLRLLDGIANVKILGGSALKAVRQLSGIFFSMNDVGVSEIITSMGNYLSNGSNYLNAIKNAQKLSDYMYQRYDDVTQHIYGGYGNVDLARRKAAKGFVKYSEFMLVMMTYADAMVSTITWQAQYDKAIMKGKSKTDATYLADRSVMLTQGDGSALNRPEILRGNLRFLTKFSSYFLSLYSSIMTDIRFRNDPKAVAHLMGTIFGVILLASLYESVMNVGWEKMFGDDDDKDVWGEWAKNVVSVSASSVIPFFGIGGNVATALTEDRVYSSKIVALSVFDDFLRLLVKDDIKLNDVVKALTPLPNSAIKFLEGEK